MRNDKFKILEDDEWQYNEEENEIIVDMRLDADEYIVEYRPESPNYEKYEIIDDKQYIYEPSINQLILSHLLNFESHTRYLIYPPVSVEADLMRMYDVEPGTPVTELAEDFRIGDEEVEVVGGETLLPDPPNLANLYHRSDRQNFETILYQDKDGDVLKNIIRGVQGAFRRWPESTTIGRSVTAKDINDLQINMSRINSKLSKAAKGLFQDVVLSGGRADSKYIASENIDGGKARQLKEV